MVIHHLEDERKRSLIGEVFDLLEPGGVFANFEHVASPTDRLHEAFFAAIGEPPGNEDPSDRLLDVETQLGWLRELGFDDVDCYWKWLEMALLIGLKPALDGYWIGPIVIGMIGAPGFEPGTSATQRRRATRLRHAPKRPV